MEQFMQQWLLSLSRFVSYRSVAVCVCATPLLHLAGILWHGLPGSNDDKRSKRLLAFAWTGGKRSLAFQLSGWVSWKVDTSLVEVDMLTVMPGSIRQPLTFEARVVARLGSTKMPRM